MVIFQPRFTCTINSNRMQSSSDCLWCKIDTHSGESRNYDWRQRLKNCYTEIWWYFFSLFTLRLWILEYSHTSQMWFIWKSLWQGNFSVIHPDECHCRVKAPDLLGSATVTDMHVSKQMLCNYLAGGNVVDEHQWLQHWWTDLACSRPSSPYRLFVRIYQSFDSHHLIHHFRPTPIWQTRQWHGSVRIAMHGKA